MNVLYLTFMVNYSINCVPLLRFVIYRVLTTQNFYLLLK